MILLSIVTFWVYPAYWVVRRRGSINRLSDRISVGPGLAWMTLALGLLATSLILAGTIQMELASRSAAMSNGFTYISYDGGAYTRGMFLDVFGNIIGLAAAILLWVCAYRFRGMLFEAEHGDARVWSLWPVFATLLFHVFYVQYRINRLPPTAPHAGTGPVPA